MPSTSTANYQLPPVQNRLQAETNASTLSRERTDANQSISCVVYKRYVLFTMTAMAVWLASTLRINLEILVLFQNKTIDSEYSCTIPEEKTNNQSIPSWDDETQTLYISAYYWTYLLTHLAAGYLADQFGGKHFVLVAILGTSICNLFVPLALSGTDYQYLFVLRTITGFFQGFFLPSVNSVLVYWTPRDIRTTIVFIVYSAALFGHVSSLLVSITLMWSSYPWTAVYYICGSVGVTWCILWQIFCYSRPQHHPSISFKEKVFLTNELEDHVVFTRKVVPWRFIIRSRPLWALMVNYILIVWCLFAFVIKMPQYMDQVLRVSHEFQFYSILILIFPMWVVIIVFACFSDWLIYEKRIDVTLFRKFTVAFAVTGCALFLLFFVFSHCDRIESDISITIATTFLCVHYATLLVNYLELAPNFVGIVTSVSSTLGYTVGISAALTLGSSSFDNTLKGGSGFFVITGVILIVGGTIYVFLGSGHEQVWNNLKEEDPN